MSPLCSFALADTDYSRKNPLESFSKPLFCRDEFRLHLVAKKFRNFLMFQKSNTFGLKGQRSTLKRGNLIEFCLNFSFRW